MLSRKTVGLVLGSGSWRGWAHIGAIEALEEEKIPIDYVIGCSVGSYVGAIYASGSLKSLREFVLRMDGKKVFSYFDVVFPRSGVLNGTKLLEELFSMHTDAVDFSDLKMMDFDQVEHTIEEGYSRVKDKMESIKFLLEPV